MNWYQYTNSNTTSAMAGLPYQFHATMMPVHPDGYYYDYYYTDDDNQLPGGKRQRRQAAATLVSNVSNWTGVGGKKSKAQPRPVVQVPPKGIGPIVEPNQNDVLCGRGGRINSHEYVILFYCTHCS